MAKQWEVEHDGIFYWGGSGKDCLRAAWLQATLAAYARHRGLECGSFFSDLEKFYENVEHGMLVSEASQDRLPIAAALRPAWPLRPAASDHLQRLLL